jgi:site-specific DNA-methyltransferase (adenine-specific)
MLDFIRCDDALSALDRLSAKSVNAVIASPPRYSGKEQEYGGIGGESSVEDYIENLLSVFSECVRVIKDTGTIAVSLSDKYVDERLRLTPHRFAIEALKLKPMRLVTVITWRQINPLTCDNPKRLGHSTEPIFIFAKSNDFQFNKADFLASGKRLKNQKRDFAKRFYFERISASTLSDERKDAARRTLNKLRKEMEKGKIYDFRMSQPKKDGFAFYRASDETKCKDVIDARIDFVEELPNLRVSSLKVTSELIKLLTSEREVVLDPFIGSGTTAAAAIKLNRHFLGFDINPEYIEYANERITHAKMQYSADLLAR